MLDRVERTDVLNAVALAAALLLCGYLLLRGFGYFSTTFDEGLWESEGGESEVPIDDAEVAAGLLLRPPNEVSIRVGNGSDGRQGLAGDATRRLEKIGYGILDPANKEGEPIDESFVFYIDGFKIDAIQVAAQLNIGESQVRPLLDNPGVSTDGADVIVILGQDADF